MTWIDINKEHPKYWINRQVIVYMKDGEMDAEYVYNDGKGGSCFHDGWNKGGRYEVTHWMPLPKPPIK